MTDLTLQQRCEVARAVTGLHWTFDRMGLATLILLSDGSEGSGEQWNPETNDTQWRMLVEWLADRISDLHTGDHRDKEMAAWAGWALIEALSRKEAYALEQLVFHILENTDG